MKITKLYLRICHFFGLNKKQEHIDDVTINIPTHYHSMNTIIDHKESDTIINDIKDQIYRKFKEDKELEIRCKNTCQVWVTFYRTDIYSSDQTSVMKSLYYKDGVLYYPCKSDKESLKRMETINKILNES